MKKDDKLMDLFKLGGCVYYSQNREDLVLLSFFPELDDGFYIDVGAFDPDLDSVTKLFYLKGWSGVNVEPQPDRYRMFEKRRKRDKNLNIGIAEKSSTLTLRSYKSQGLSTFSGKLKQKYEYEPDIDTTDYSEYQVPVRPLAEVLNELDVPHINFMKVDVEGLEYEVLKSNDWKKFRPEVLCIESNHVEKDWRPLLREADYEFVFDDGLNEYYADKASGRKEKFDYVKEVVHYRGGGIRADHFELMIELGRRLSDKTHHVEVLAAEQMKNAAKLREYEILKQQSNSIKETAERLLRLIKRNAAAMFGRK